jgi:hypothetical protein
MEITDIFPFHWYLGQVFVMEKIANKIDNPMFCEKRIDYGKCHRQK